MDLDSKNHEKGQRSKLQLDQPSSRLERLPLEIVYNVLSRLPITSLVHFKCVSQAWRALAQDPLLASLFLSSRTEDDPSLILHCDSPIQNHLYFVDIASYNDDKQKVKRINTPFWSTVPEFKVVGSSNGLLCLSNSLFNNALYIYNPLTRNYKELPQSFHYSYQKVIGFGYHQMTKEYKVIRIVHCNYKPYPTRDVPPPDSELQILTLGSLTWRNLGKVSYRLGRCASEVLVNGKLHWYTRPISNPIRKLLVSFDLANEQFGEVPTPDFGSTYYFLADLRRHLSAAVHFGRERLDVWVMKEYNVKDSWVKEYTIGNYVPKGLEGDRLPFKISPLAAMRGSGFVRVLCKLKNGELLLEYESRVLVSYDSKNGKFKDLTLQGKPNWFKTIVHFGNLNWIDTRVNTLKCRNEEAGTSSMGI